MLPVGKGQALRPRVRALIGDMDPCAIAAPPIGTASKELKYLRSADVLRVNAQQADKFRAVFALGQGQDYDFWAHYDGMVMLVQAQYENITPWTNLIYGICDRLEFDQNRREVIVTGRSMLALMINSQQLNGAYINQSAKDVIEQNTKNYGLEAVFDAPPDNPFGVHVDGDHSWHVQGSQTVNIKTWDLIGQAATHYNLTAFAEGNVVYYYKEYEPRNYQCVAGTPQYVTGAATTISQSNAISLKFFHDFTMVRYDLVLGTLHDQNTPKTITQQSNADPCEAAKNNPHHIRHHNLTEEDAQIKVDSYGEHLGTFEWLCEWIAADPELLSARVVDKFTVSGTNSECDGPYLITQIEFNFHYERGLTITVNGKWGESVPVQNTAGA